MRCTARLIPVTFRTFFKFNGFATLTDAHDAARLTLDGREVVLLRGDVLTEDLDGASVLVASTFLFPDAVLRALQERLVASLNPGAVIVSGKQFLGCHRGLSC